MADRLCARVDVNVADRDLGGIRARNIFFWQSYLIGSGEGTNYILKSPLTNIEVIWVE